MAPIQDGPDSPRAGCSRTGTSFRFRTALPTLLFAGLALAGSASKAEAQAQAVIEPVQFSLILGQSLATYDDDCDDPESFFTFARLSLATARFGVSVAHVHEDWPWPPDEELDGGEFLLRHGDAYQVLGEVYPLGFLGFGETRVGRMVRPFIAAGAQVSRDGDSGDAPIGRSVYTVSGSTDPIAAVGASLFLRPAVLPVAIHVQYRHTALFASDFELQGPTGSVVTVDGETLKWGELSVGFSIGVGG